MALPVILFNSTGSDTAASGAGPGTALTGSGAALSASTSIDLSADSPDLSGVATDGSHVLYVNSSSGRQYFKITNTNNTTKIVTVANAATPTESGRAWAIGGKLAAPTATHASKLFSADLLPGWICEFEDDQTISTAVTCSVSGDTTTGPIIVRGKSGARRVLTQSGNVANFDGNNFNYWRFENLKLQCTNATRNAAYGINWRGNGITIKNCVLGDATNKLTAGLRRQGGSLLARIIDTEILYCNAGGLIDASAANSSYQIIGCSIHDNTTFGVQVGPNTVVQDCVIYANTTDGIVFSAAPNNTLICRNTINGNSGDGIDTSTAVGYLLSIHSNNLTANGNYGIRAASGQNLLAFADYNNFGTGATANTSGSVLNLNAGAADLAVDPSYTNSGTGDFSAGTSIKAKGFPDSTRYIGANVSGTIDYVDVGIQRQESGSGGGGPLIGGRLVGHRL